jgi:hypothetical protein
LFNFLFILLNKFYIFDLRMMLDITYHNKEKEETIDALLGKSFGFWKRLQLKGIGSQRMVLVKTSPGFCQYKNSISDINYLSIELRPNGILVHLNKGLRNLAWSIPYYQLSVFKTDIFSLHAQGEFLSVSCDKNYHGNKLFVNKMELLKNTYLNQTSLPYKI